MKTLGMDKPTRSLPEVKGESTGLRYRILPPERARIKPVFDKMLEALRMVDDNGHGDIKQPDGIPLRQQQVVRQAIKEAGELGL